MLIKSGVLVKHFFFGKHEIKLDYHKTRGFCNMLGSSILAKCGCGLCSHLSSLPEKCAECRAEISNLGVDQSKPLELACVQLDATIMTSLIYQLEGRLYKPLTGQEYFNARHACPACKTEYFLAEDFAKHSTLLLKAHREINAGELNIVASPRHLERTASR